MTFLRARLSSILLVVFFASGVASLIYQTVWIRQFSLILGGTNFSMSVVISTFMCGLALGGALFGRVVDRVRRPLVLYAVLELAIAACAAVLAVTGPVRERMVQAVLSTPELEGTLGLRIAIAAVWLGVPCVLIGGTLPVMVRFAVRSLAHLGHQVAWLYFVNTLGAAAGALATGFFLVELLGLRGTAAVAIGINVLIAVVALLVERIAAAPASEVTAVDPAVPAADAVPAAPWVVALAFFLSGFCALVLEMSWTRLILGYLQSAVLVISMILAVVLVGFALGGIAVSKVADRHPRPVQLAAVLFSCTALATLLGLASVGVLTSLPYDDGFAPEPYMVVGVLAIVFPSSALMGATFPLVLRILVTSQARVGSQLGAFYALNTFGTVLGGVAAPFFLIPRIGTSGAILLGVGLQLAAGLVLLSQSWGTANWRVRGGVLALAAVTLALAPSQRDAYHQTLSALARQNLPDWSKELAYVEGPDSTVVLYGTSSAHNEGMGEANRYRIQVNASPIVAFDTTETKLMAHLPLMAVPDPKRALVICFGMGNTFRSALAHGIEVEVADINGAVPGLARIHQDDPSQTFDNPRGHIATNDGRNFLLLTPHQYDMITIDPAPPVWGVGLGNIQSKEFYELMSDRLTDQGVAEAWMLSGSDRDFRATLAAFREVFPYIAVFRPIKHAAFHVLGSKRPIRFTEARRQALLNMPAVREDLGERGLEYLSVPQLEDLYLSDEGGVDVELGQAAAPLIDDRPILEYRLLRDGADRPFTFSTQAQRRFVLTQ